MGFGKLKIKLPVIQKPLSKSSITIWCVAAVVCILFSALVLSAPDRVKREYTKVDCQEQWVQPYELQPGGVLEQHFTALGQSVGEVSHLYLHLLREETAAGSLSVRLYRERQEELLADVSVEFSQLPGYMDLKAYTDTLMEEDAEVPGNSLMLGDGGWYQLKSGEHYRLEVINHSDSDSVYLLGNDWVQSGKLLIDGQRQEGFINLSWMRKSLYAPSRLLTLLVLLTDVAVLLGLGLVLFTDIKTHVLYLILAMGFGIVMLFDLTPLYGFDMRFQFDSTYVVSNVLLGQEGLVTIPYGEEPHEVSYGYYRRACDDYSQYQLFKGNEVSANYTDMKAGLRNLRASEEEQALELVHADLGFVSEQLYMYLPQAAGFAVARLLGLGLYPMLQLARILSYAVFTAVMYFAIKKIPYGKQIFLVWALVPTVMVQMLSLSRDAMIICVSFYVIAKTMQMAYGEQKPNWKDWVPTLIASALLAPCKMIYIPVSCLFLLTIYRCYIQPAGERGKKILLRVVLLGAVAAAAFVALNIQTFLSVLSSGNVSVYDSEAYSLTYLLTHPTELLYLLGNTLRTDLGAYLVNAVQLFDIELGCSDAITITVFALMALSCCGEETETLTLRKGERAYMLLVAVGVLVLTALASIRWTPADSDVIVGLQGRYLTPVLPLVCLACWNTRVVKVHADAALIVKVGCCIFPAVTLMNMYLWTIAR